MNENNKSDTPKFTITLQLLVDYLINYSCEYRKVSLLEMNTYFTKRTEFFEGLPADEASKWNDLNYEIDQEYMDECEVQIRPDSSVRTQIKRLIENYLMVPLPCGVSIWSSKEKKLAIIASNTEKIFYAKTLLNETAVKLLCDAIEVYPYADSGQTENIIKNLNKFIPHFNRRSFNPNSIDAPKNPGTYYQNIEQIYKAFSKVKYEQGNEEITAKDKKLLQSEYDKKYRKEISQISFEYYEYDENKKLVPKKLENGEITRIVNPVKLMWSSGFCYLVAAVPSFKDKNKLIFINYRVDRMRNVRCLDTPSLYKPYNAETDPGNHPEAYPRVYSTKNPYMYSDNEEQRKSVVLICSKKLINKALDVFGFGIRIEKTDDPEKFEITIRKVSYTGVKMFALQYFDKCEVKEPPELRKEMKNAVKQLIKTYKD